MRPPPRSPVPVRGRTVPQPAVSGTGDLGGVSPPRPARDGAHGERRASLGENVRMTPWRLGPVPVGSPVLLAPMAGVTNPPFRKLCREAGLAALDDDARATARPGAHAPAGLYVTEMVTSRALVERNEETMRMVEPDPLEPVRSVQLYGVDPATVPAAVRIPVDADRADHGDLNFGCPVPKVARKGGGAALPWKRDLFRGIVTGAVDAARRGSRDRDREVPVTVKMRMGIDDDHLTYLDAGRIAENAGVAAVALH